MNSSTAAVRRDEAKTSKPYIIVGESTAHQWVVKDSRATLGAVFRHVDVALRFARREARALGCGVVVVRAEAVNLDCLE